MSCFAAAGSLSPTAAPRRISGAERFDLTMIAPCLVRAPFRACQAASKAGDCYGTVNIPKDECRRQGRTWRLI